MNLYVVYVYRPLLLEGHRSHSQLVAKCTAISMVCQVCVERQHIYIYNKLFDTTVPVDAHTWYIYIYTPINIANLNSSSEVLRSFLLRVELSRI